jgi:hypothetical protein
VNGPWVFGKEEKEELGLQCLYNYGPISNLGVRELAPAFQGVPDVSWFMIRDAVQRKPNPPSLPFMKGGKFFKDKLLIILIVRKSRDEKYDGTGRKKGWLESKYLTLSSVRAGCSLR